MRLRGKTSWKGWTLADKEDLFWWRTGIIFQKRFGRNDGNGESGF
jgi:hypothetical protein